MSKSKYSEFKEKALKADEEAYYSCCPNYYGELVEDMLFEIQQLEHSHYTLLNNISSELSSFYPRITKDPTVNCYKNNDLISSVVLDNPNFIKLKELEIYSLSESEYSVRTEAQLQYLSNFVDLEENVNYYISFE